MDRFLRPQAMTKTRSQQLSEKADEQRRRFDIRFWRDGDKTRWGVLKGNHDAIARRSYASGSHLRADDTAFSFGS